MFPFGRRRGRILGFNLSYFRSIRVHPTLNPERFSLDLAQASPPNSFEEKHLAEVLEIIAGTDILQHLKPWQVKILKSFVWECKGKDAEIHRLLLTWFDIFNSAFFGGSLKLLRDHIIVEEALPTTKLLGSFAFGLGRGSIGRLVVTNRHKDLDPDNPCR